ncbi:uncharacterized protein LOC141639400 [Silene latifolia]|uniref:uncharacterized protein LOC141639400 n=1 Tax=Silene latifolia TaxID=37657 RepID=UPI003D76E7CA
MVYKKGCLCGISSGNLHVFIGPWAIEVIEAVGVLFTWNNKQRPEDRTYSRLDRFMINKKWVDLFPDLYAHFLPEDTYDHTPCIVWQRKVNGTPMFQVVMKLKDPKLVLKQLNKERYPDIENNTCILQMYVHKILEELGIHPTNIYYLIAEEHKTLQDLKDMIEARNNFLTHKAKVKWINEGDANTVYFHGAIKQRRVKNKVVMMIEDKDGVMCNSSKHIQDAFLDYYHGLLGTSNHTSRLRTSIIKYEKVCTEEHYASMLNSVTTDEIKAVLFSIPDDKSPGPDGYTSRFSKMPGNMFEGILL